MTRHTVRALCTVCILLLSAGLNSALAQGTGTGSGEVIVVVSPNSFDRVGFGEMTPGPHDFRIKASANNGETFYGFATDMTGTTLWDAVPTGPNSEDYVVYGASEDELGWIQVDGIIDDGSGMMMDVFTIQASNALFPCAACPIDPVTGMPMCGGSMVCDNTTEGEASVDAGASTSVSLTIHHGGSGTLTITGGTADLELQNPDGTPFTSLTISGSGISSVTVVLQASATFSSTTELTCDFLQAGGTLGSQDVMNVVLAVAAPTVEVESLTATESDATGTTTSNALTVTDTTSETLYIAKRFGLPNAQSWVVLNLGFAVGSTPPPASQILYAVDGAGATNASGSLATAPVPLVGLDVGVVYTVSVGVDDNTDGVLDPAEKTQMLLVRVIDFDFSVVQAQRTSAPAESLYPIKAGEHFEVGGTFRFKLTGGVTGQPSLIKYDLWDLDGPNDKLTSGSGLSFSYTFVAGVDENNVNVSFYTDFNEDGVRTGPLPDPLAYEYNIDSEDFWVMKKKVRTFSVQHSNLVSQLVLNPGAGADAIIQGKFDSNADILLRKDSADDWRACVRFVVDTTTNIPPVFASGPTRPDPAPLLADQQLHFGQPHNMTFLNKIDGSATGKTLNSKMVFDWNLMGANTIAHEVGHALGLAVGTNHAGYFAQHVMFGSLVSTAVELKESDVGNYDQ